MQALQTFIDSELSRIKAVRDELLYLEMLATQMGESAGRAKLAADADKSAAIDTMKSEVAALLRDRVSALVRLAEATGAFGSAPTPQVLNLSRAADPPPTEPAMTEARRRELLGMTSAGAAVLDAEAKAKLKAGEDQGRAYADYEVARRERLAQINAAYR